MDLSWSTGRELGLTPEGSAARRSTVGSADWGVAEDSPTRQVWTGEAPPKRADTQRSPDGVIGQIS
jgi:hypothetical protein